MALKYYIEYNDTVNVLHRFELYDDNYIDPPIEVQGYVTMDYGQVDENLEAIRGQGLRVNLEADASLTFEELFEENEKNFKCIYYRNNVILFQGWLNPEGFFEDYVNDKWIVSFDCIDGLGYLKKLAFVNDNGTNITGIKSQLEILSLALRRTGIEANINVNIDVFYTGLPDTLSVLERVKANTRRYIKDDDFTVMNCEEVVRDILEPYGAVLTSYNGRWAIYKPNQLVSNQTATFFRYDYLGVALSPTTVTYDFDFTIGSQLDGFDPHYCNGNQSFTNQPSIGAYRINYKYGNFISLIENDDFYNNGTIDEWTFFVNSRMTLPSLGESGVLFQNKPNLSPTVWDLSIKSDPISLEQNVLIKLNSTAEVVADGGFTANFIGPSKVVLTLSGAGAGSTYFYDGFSDAWTTDSSDFLLLSYGTGSNVTAKDIPALPIDGDLRINYYGVVSAYNTDPDFTLLLDNLSVSVENSANSEIKGVTFTFERTDKPSARVLSTKKVVTGDDENNIYQGTLYQFDGITPTETWYRKGITEALPILSLMGSETMRMNANTMRIFSGDIFGYFNYLSVITLDQRVGKFGVTKYSYDTKKNIISAELKQMFGDELTDLKIERAEDYGNVVEPTIRG